MLARIAAAACPQSDMTVLEIGPGQGALTRHLLERASRVIAVEIDPSLVEHLQIAFAAQPRFTVVPGDVLQVDLSQWGNVAVAGNLPYYITSPIVERVLALGPLWQRAVFLVQKEVALRLAAQPGHRDYGYLSVLAQFHADVKVLFSVPPGAFQPPPRVDSAVVQLTPREQLEAVEPAAFLRFAGRCFQHKRKTLRNNLAPYYPAEVLLQAPDLSRRAEQLSREELLALYCSLPDAEPPDTEPKVAPD